MGCQPCAQHIVKEFPLLLFALVIICDRGVEETKGSELRVNGNNLGIYRIFVNIFLFLGIGLDWDTVCFQWYH